MRALCKQNLSKAIWSFDVRSFSIFLGGAVDSSIQSTWPHYRTTNANTTQQLQEVGLMALRAVVVVVEEIVAERLVEVVLVSLCLRECRPTVSKPNNNYYSERLTLSNWVLRCSAFRLSAFWKLANKAGILSQSSFDKAPSLSKSNNATYVLIFLL